MKDLASKPTPCLPNQFRGNKNRGWRQAPLANELRLLLVENSVHDELSIINELHWGGFEVLHKRIETATDFEAELEANRWDLVVCDHCLREGGGLKILQLFQQFSLDIPFIVVSAVASDADISTVLLSGAKDFLMKQNLSGLVPAIRRELRAAQEQHSLRLAADTHWQLISSPESCNSFLGLSD